MRPVGLLRTGRNKRRNGLVQGLEKSAEWDMWEAAQKMEPKEENMAGEEKRLQDR